MGFVEPHSFNVQISVLDMTQISTFLIRLLNVYLNISFQKSFEEFSL